MFVNSVWTVAAAASLSSTSMPAGALVADEDRGTSQFIRLRFMQLQHVLCQLISHLESKRSAIADTGNLRGKA